jgi:hypothetical protein
MNRRQFFLTLAALPTVSKFLKKLGLVRPQPEPLDFYAVGGHDLFGLAYYQINGNHGSYMGIPRDNYAAYNMPAWTASEVEELDDYAVHVNRAIADSFNNYLDEAILNDSRPV